MKLTTKEITDAFKAFLNEENISSEFFHNRKKNNDGKPLIKIPSIGGAGIVSSGFVWSTTKEGWDFWDNINKKWTELFYSLRELPEEVIEAMLQNQVAQGNKRDISIFQDNIYADDTEGGFDWAQTKEGIDFWETTLVSRDFSLFFETYKKGEDLSWQPTAIDLDLLREVMGMSKTPRIKDEEKSKINVELDIEREIRMCEEISDVENAVKNSMDTAEFAFSILKDRVNSEQMKDLTNKHKEHTKFILTAAYNRSMEIVDEQYK